jgi:hypothetical protein
MRFAVSPKLKIPSKVEFLRLRLIIQNKTAGFGQRPRPLHDRYTRTDTFVRWVMAVTYSRCKFVTVSLPKLKAPV